MRDAEQVVAPLSWAAGRRLTDQHRCIGYENEDVFLHPSKVRSEATQSKTSAGS